MQEINWNIFKAKFAGKEQNTFENLTYQLFCSEHGNNIGIFRFKNQTGIETEPIKCDQDCVGFQAKFFSSKLSDNKGKIIDSIKKAKRENSNLTKILFYLNDSFSESNIHGKKDPKYKIAIEEEASGLNLKIDWRVPSHIARQLALPENQYLADFYFSQRKNIIDFLIEIKEHTENLLYSIHTDIIYGKHSIKIDRTKEIENLKNQINEVNALIVSGQGGCGKTAIIKELYRQIKEEIPFYGFKATEFNVQSIDTLIGSDGNFSLNDFIKAHAEEPNKIVLIDSAEKISDLDNQEPFKEFLSELLKNSWTIIFTTRLSFLNDLRYQFLSILRINFDEIQINILTLNELESIANQYSFELPSNTKLKKLIRNPFYLDEYLRLYTTDRDLSSYSQFKERIWLRKIQNSSYTRNNTNILRENCFLSIVKRKTEQGIFYISPMDYSNEILALLLRDEIIGFDSKSGGYFITHDIYEEWGQEILIKRAFKNSPEYIDFLTAIGSSLSIRRAFRNWLSEMLSDNLDEIKPFIEDGLVSQNIALFWKDEILTSILLSNYSQYFFSNFEEFILENNHQILRKIIFQLRISCKEVDTSITSFLDNSEEFNLNNIFTKPTGPGWQSTINFIFENADKFNTASLNYILPLLLESSSYNDNGQTTKQVGLIALKFFTELEGLGNNIFQRNSNPNTLIDIILNSSGEIKTELSQIFEGIIKNGHIDRKDKFYNLCETLISSDLKILPIVRELPDYVLRIAELFWYNQPHDSHRFVSGVEPHYNISSRPNYFPPSALQTPIYYLLHSSYSKTIDFIINFTNRSIQAYVDSGFDDSIEEVKVIFPSGKSIKQYLSHSLWNMYRGIGSPLTPYLLQSIHMALEKFLLKEAENEYTETMRDKLLYLIEKSISSSISAVVTSVVLAYPNKFFDIAKTLFSSIQYIHFDGHRSTFGEGEAMSINSLGFDLQRDKHFKIERAETFKQPHRKHSLESLIVYYQYFRDESTTAKEVKDRQKEIWEIIDYHKKNQQELNQPTQNKNNLLLLSRIDSRKMDPTIEKGEKGVIINFNPQVDPELKKHSEKVQKAFKERKKYLSLELWAKSKFEGRKRNINHKRYDDNPTLVLKETKEILKGLKGDCDFDFYINNYSIPAFSCAILIGDFFSELPAEEQIFCKDVILHYANAPLRHGYQYQISDGVESAINTIPLLMEQFSTFDTEFVLPLYLILFDNYPIGHYKRICDYSIESIQNKLPENKTKNIIFTFIKFKLDFNQLLNENKKKFLRENRSYNYVQVETITDFLKNYDEAVINNLSSSPDQQDWVISDYPLEDLEIIFRLIPSDTSDKELLNLSLELILIFSKRLFYKDDTIEHNLRLRIFRKYSNFILSREKDEVKKFVKPFVEEFRFTEEAAWFFGEIIRAENEEKTYEQFWYVWKSFYPKIIDNLQYDDYITSHVIHNYLLAWNYWSKNISSWPSLREREKKFYRDIVKDIGHFPSVLDSVAKLLNQIGSDFLNDGMFWIAHLVEKNTSKSLEKNTIYYIEKLVRKYIYLNRSKVKKEIKVKGPIIKILDFLVQNGSVNGYLLREDVL
ncbi:AVAST type 4 anti-phage nuclease Avs4 [Membranihabitans maritimus]|uniref:AVAST type 4 anti-phage nuclease Avs4 n=1 Tax=Membranihabitans maritimus TaxID=2904244 RepID=UPI001F483959